MNIEEPHTNVRQHKTSMHGGSIPREAGSGANEVSGDGEVWLHPHEKTSWTGARDHES